jgi:hypothetical protein
MKLRTWMVSATVLSSGLLAAGAGMATGAPVHARTTHGPDSRNLTWAALRTMSAAQVARLQNPLIAAGTPVDNLAGTARWSGLFSSLSLDTPRHVIDLYVTNPARAGALLAAAKKSDPHLNPSLFRVFRARYSIRQINAASSRLLTASSRGLLPFRVYEVRHPGNSRTLQVMVASPRADQRLAGIRLGRLGGHSVMSLAGVALKFAHGTPVYPLGRGNDTSPFIGGDEITDLSSDCTAGIAVENKSTGRDYIITAAHCFAKNAAVYNGDLSENVGKVTSSDLPHDVELIDTGKFNGLGSQALEGESNTSSGGIKFFALVDTVGAMDNEIVYQDGYQYFVDNGGVDKDYYTSGTAEWSVTDSFGTYNVFGYEVGSDAGGTCNTSSQVGCAGVGGDSGAVVFTYKSSPDRNALGMVSAGTGGADCTNADNHLCTHMLFTPINPILTNTGLILNPFN